MKGTTQLIRSLVMMAVIVSLAQSQQSQWTCNETIAIEAFKAQNSTGVVPNYTIDPYSITDPIYLEKVQENLNVTDLFCGLRYTDESRLNYVLKTLTEEELKYSPNFYITHKGKCGACSTTQDLTVYLELDLTDPVRSCGLKNAFSQAKNLQCLLALGFTYPCAQIWLYNTLNTRKDCGATCFLSYMENEPFIVDGHLNDCLQCDEDNSGPIFKYESGRTRRDSGIESEIQRPSDQIYPMEHCYY